MYQDQLSLTFSALSDPTRRAILERLANGEATAGELAQPFGISKPAISKHLKVLENARLITRKKQAQWHCCQLAPTPLKAASDWITYYQAFWEHQFDALANYLDKTE